MSTLNEQLKAALAARAAARPEPSPQAPEPEPTPQHAPAPHVHEPRLVCATCLEELPPDTPSGTGSLSSRLAALVKERP